MKLVPHCHPSSSLHSKLLLVVLVVFLFGLFVPSPTLETDENGGVVGVASSLRQYPMREPVSTTSGHGLLTHRHVTLLSNMTLVGEDFHSNAQQTEFCHDVEKDCNRNHSIFALPIRLYNFTAIIICEYWRVSWSLWLSLCLPRLLQSLERVTHYLKNCSAYQLVLPYAEFMDAFLEEFMSIDTQCYSVLPIHGWKASSNSYIWSAGVPLLASGCAVAFKYAVLLPSTSGGTPALLTPPKAVQCRPCYNVLLLSTIDSSLPATVFGHISEIASRSRCISPRLYVLGLHPLSELMPIIELASAVVVMVSDLVTLAPFLPDASTVLALSANGTSGSVDNILLCERVSCTFSRIDRIGFHLKPTCTCVPHSSCVVSAAHFHNISVSYNCDGVRQMAKHLGTHREKGKLKYTIITNASVVKLVKQTTSYYKARFYNEIQLSASLTHVTPPLLIPNASLLDVNYSFSHMKYWEGTGVTAKIYGLCQSKDTRQFMLVQEVLPFDYIRDSLTPIEYINALRTFTGLWDRSVAMNGSTFLFYGDSPQRNWRFDVLRTLKMFDFDASRLIYLRTMCGSSSHCGSGSAAVPTCNLVTGYCDIPQMKRLQTYHIQLWITELLRVAPAMFRNVTLYKRTRRRSPHFNRTDVHLLISDLLMLQKNPWSEH